MRKNFMDDLSINDLKSHIKDLKLEQTKKNNASKFLFFALLLAAVAGLVFAIVKYLKCEDEFDEYDNFDDFEEDYDENGCIYTDEEDFE